jgi:prepilin-type N-terminal cleavage/methylation domain-containing protein
VSDRHQGFTLIELIVALMIIVVLVGVAIPAMQGLSDERGARKPIDALVGMVQEVRSRAMLEQEAYQIVFDADGIYALRYFHPYRTRNDFKQLLIEMKEPAEDGGITTEPVIQVNEGSEGLPAANLLAEIIDAQPNREVAKRRDTWLKTYKKPVEIDLSVLFWGDSKWNKVENDYFRRWVFQPTGLCNPIQVKTEQGDGFFEIHFDALTGEVLREKYYVPPDKKGDNQ